MSVDIPEDAGIDPASFPLTDEQLDAIVKFIVAHGKARARMQGSDFSEYDFLAGAMTWFFALKMQDRMPAHWIFDAFTGRSALGIEVPDPTVYVVVAGQLRQIVGVYRDRHLANEHADWLADHGDDRATVLASVARSSMDPKVQERMDAEAEDEAIKREEDRSYGDK